jgi:hypothetical protein
MLDKDCRRDMNKPTRKDFEDFAEGLELSQNILCRITRKPPSRVPELRYMEAADVMRDSFY